MRRYESWGRLPKATAAGVRRIQWRNQLGDIDFEAGPMLPVGLGRSYGDSGLNDGARRIEVPGHCRARPGEVDRHPFAANFQADTNRRSVVEAVPEPMDPVGQAPDLPRHLTGSGFLELAHGDLHGVEALLVHEAPQ